MKKLKGILVLILLLALIASPIAVLASNISGALYYGTIIVSNNSTATTNVAVNCTISTPALIAGGYLNSSANNCAVRSTSGVDVLFMPGANTSLPWCFWVPNIGTNSHLSYLLYTANSTGGEFRYFPSPTGNMTSVDNDTNFELGGNFTIEQKGWVDTDPFSIANAEDFITYTEFDANNKLTVTATTATGVNVDTNEDVYLYYDYGANNFDGLNIDFEIFISSQSLNNSNGGVAVSNVIDDFSGFAATDLSVLGQRQAGPYAIVLQRGFGAAADSFVAAADTSYYCTIYRAAGNDNAFVRIYTDPARTVLVDTLTVNGFGAAKWQYAYGFVNFNSGVGGEDWDGYVRNLDLTGTSGTKALVLKPAAFTTYVSGSGNITSAIAGTSGNVTATGVASGEHTVTTQATGNSTIWATGDVLNFDGTNDVEMGAIYGAENDFAISGWFKLTADFSAISPADLFIVANWVDVNNNFTVRLESADGRLRFATEKLGAEKLMVSTATSWSAGVWHHFLAISSATDGGFLYIDGNLEDDDATVNWGLVAAGDFIIGERVDDAGVGWEGVIMNVATFTDNLTVTERPELYQGIVPADAVDYWYLDEGTGTAIVSYGTGGNDGIADAGDWITSTYAGSDYTGRLCDLVISIDDTVARFGNNAIGKGATVPNNTSDWTFCQNGSIIYLEYQTITIGGTLQQEIEWEYSDNFTDLSGQGHWAIPTFRTTTSDPDVSAVFTSFLPIEEAKAPAYALEDAPPFIETVPSIVSGFGTTPPTGGFPLADVITVVAAATSTPPQLPLLIIAVFVILACSLSISYGMRKYGSGSLIVKIATITAVMGVFIALKNFGIDFWMLVVFLVVATSLAMASKQTGWN